MPQWRVHVLIGMILNIVLIYICYNIGLWHLFFHRNQIQFLFCFHVGVISLLGTLFPDYDYRKTKIRHVIGPILVGFLLISFIYMNRFELLKTDPIPVLFLVIAILFILFIFGLIIPFKHHGKLHSVTAAIIYSGIWICVELFVFEMSILQAGIIGLFGFVGYFSHLVLDWDLKWFT